MQTAKSGHKIAKEQPDFRKTLNFMLSVYYEKENAIVIHQEIQIAKLPVSDDNLSAGFLTLLKDGHVEQILPEFSFYPMGMITGQGRMFYEAGGYKDDTTRVDRIIKWGKNNRLVACLIVLVVALTSLLGLVELIAKVWDILKPITR